MPSDPARPVDPPHRHRAAAESFGDDPARYDRARPRYPDELVEWIASATGHGTVLDVGTGTGILARQLEAAGCRVLGLDPDARLAAFARGTGVDVEVATLEDWQPAGRSFDAVVAGESWHWIDPVAGAARAAAVLRPGGLLAAAWSTGQPASSDVAEAFLEVYRAVLPPAFAARVEPAAIDEAQAALRARVAAGIRSAGAFEEPAERRIEWEQRYTRDEWLDALQTTGVLAGELLAALLAGVGAVIDRAGGGFTMRYTTFAVTAVRRA